MRIGATGCRGARPRTSAPEGGRARRPSRGRARPGGARTGCSWERSRRLERRCCRPPRCERCSGRFASRAVPAHRSALAGGRPRTPRGRGCALRVGAHSLAARAPTAAPMSRSRRGCAISGVGSGFRGGGCGRSGLARPGLASKRRLQRPGRRSRIRGSAASASGRAGRT